jgi:hypothetical protein
MDENNRIKVSSLRNLIEGKREIDLTEQEIFNILVQEESAIMSKSELINEISQNIINEARMNDNIRRDLENGTTDYSQHLDRETIQRLANDMFDEIQTNAREKGVNNVLQAQERMMYALQHTMRVEQAHKGELEALAVQLVKEQFNLSDDEIEFEPHLLIIGQVNKGELKYGPQDVGDVPEAPAQPQAPRQQEPRGERPRRRDRGQEGGQGEQPSGETPTPQPNRRRTKEELKPEITKRRLINAMMHGAARKSQYLYHMTDRLDNIDPRLKDSYTDIMVGNDSTYWVMSDDDIQMAAQMGEQHAGNVKVEYKNRPEGMPPKIIAQGISFPMLLHELAKGVVEVLGMWHTFNDAEEEKYVKGQTDHLANETWDIRIGPKIWEKITMSIPDEGQDYQKEIFAELFQIPADDFNSFMSGILNDDAEALERLSEITDEVVERQRGYDYEDTMSQFRDDDEGYEEEGEFADPEGEPGIDDLLGGGSDEDEGEFDPSTLSRRELQDMIDQALDDGDFETVAYLSKFMK